jgi:voltage-gated potassium channel
MNVSSARKRLHEVIQAPVSQGTGARMDAFDIALASIIVLSVVCGMLETVDAVRERMGQTLWALEHVFAAVFLVEYVLRVWTAVEEPRYAHPVYGRLRYMLSPMAVIDLLAILPTLLPHVGINLMVLRALRITRLIKLGRYSSALETLSRVVASRRAELLVMAVAGAVVLLISAWVMYELEHEAQPEIFSSVPAALWWAVITLTTIGYGDAAPITPWGKLIGGVVALFGIGVVALPTAVLGSAFADDVRARREKHLCPHCGKPVAVDKP